jgi:hypothetical protein
MLCIIYTIFTFANSAQSPLTLSALKTPAPKAEIAPAATPTPSFSFGGAGAVKSAAGEVKPEQPKASLLTTAAAPKTEPPASLSSQSAVKPAEILTNLRGKTMDDILTEWQTELQNSVASFHRKAADIARIDARLIENSDKVFS